MAKKKKKPYSPGTGKAQDAGYGRPGPGVSGRSWENEDVRRMHTPPKKGVPIPRGMYDELYKIKQQYAKGSPVINLGSANLQSKIDPRVFTHTAEMERSMRTLGHTRQMMMPYTAASAVFEPEDMIRKQGVPPMARASVDPRQMRMTFPGMGAYGSPIGPQPAAAAGPAAVQGQGYANPLDPWRGHGATGKPPTGKAAVASNKATQKAVKEIVEEVSKTGKMGKVAGGVGNFLKTWGLRRILPFFLISELVSQIGGIPAAARGEKLQHDLSLSNALSGMVDMEDLQMQSLGQEMELANVFGKIQSPSESAEYQQMIQNNLPLLQMSAMMSQLPPRGMAGGQPPMGGM